MMDKKTYIIIFSIFCCTFAFAQKERKDIKNGNRQYEKKEYENAEKAYREAVLKNKNSIEANFNLGNALYRQKKIDTAKEQFQMIAETAKSKKTAAVAYHNLGNAFMSEKDYANSAEAYKKSLYLNPTDDETRYNLALANALLKKQQQQPKPQENEPPKEQEQQLLDAFQENEQQLLNRTNETQITNKRPLEKDW